MLQSLLNTACQNGPSSGIQKAILTNGKDFPGDVPDLRLYYEGVKTTRGRFVMTITSVDMELAKNMFAVHSIGQNGNTVLVIHRAARAALPALIAALLPCIFG